MRRDRRPRLKGWVRPADTGCSTIVQAVNEEPTVIATARLLAAIASSDADYARLGLIRGDIKAWDDGARTDDRPGTSRRASVVQDSEKRRSRPRNRRRTIGASRSSVAHIVRAIRTVRAIGRR
jgi:hypothetical protein